MKLCRPQDDQYVYAYLTNTDTDDVAPGLPVVPAPTKPRPKPADKPHKPRATTKTKLASEPQLLPLIQQKIQSDVNRFDSSGQRTGSSTDSSTILSKQSKNVVIIDSEESSLDSLPSVSGMSDNFKSKTKTTSAKPTTYSSETEHEPVSVFDRLKQSMAALSNPVAMETKDSSSQGSVRSVSSAGTDVSDSSVPQFVLYPGQYEIVLCIDNAEFYGA